MLFSMKHLVIGILGQQEVDVWILVWGARKASLIFVSTAACQLAVHLVLGLGWEGERGQAPCHPNLPSGWTGFQGWDKVKPERWRHWPQGTAKWCAEPQGSSPRGWDSVLKLYPWQAHPPPFGSLNRVSAEFLATQDLCLSLSEASPPSLPPLLCMCLEFLTFHRLNPQPFPWKLYIFNLQNIYLPFHLNLMLFTF